MTALVGVARAPAAVLPLPVAVALAEFEVGAASARTLDVAALLTAVVGAAELTPDIAVAPPPLHAASTPIPPQAAKPLANNDRRESRWRSA
jgi:hypothetical protein